MLGGRLRPGARARAPGALAEFHRPAGGPQPGGGDLPSDPGRRGRLRAGPGRCSSASSCASMPGSSPSPHGREMHGRPLSRATTKCSPAARALSAPMDGATVRAAARADRGPSGCALYVYRGDARRSLRALLAGSHGRHGPSGLDAGHRGFTPGLGRSLAAARRPSRSCASRIDLVRVRDARGAGRLCTEARPWPSFPSWAASGCCTRGAEAAVCGCPVVGPDLPPVRDYLVRGRPREPASSVAATRRLAPTRGHCDRLLVRPRCADGGGRGASAPARGRSPTPWRAVAARLERASTGRPSPPPTGDEVAGQDAGGRPLPARARHRRGAAPEAGAAAAPGPDAARLDQRRPAHAHQLLQGLHELRWRRSSRTAREIGLGAIAITDHNEIKGAFLARELAEGDPFVIVAEEVKTAEGEVIGLFLKELIPPELSFDETLSLIKEQGGLVYVPHPFDALRTTPSYRALVDNLHRIDVIEIYNAKVALSSFNLSAERFAAKYNIVAGAGSDAHVLPGPGHGDAAHAALHTIRRASWPPCGRPTSSPGARACSICSRSSCCRPRSTGCCPRTSSPCRATTLERPIVRRITRSAAPEYPATPAAERSSGRPRGAGTSSSERIVKDSQPLAEANEIYRKLEERAIAESNDLNHRVVALPQVPPGQSSCPPSGSGHPLADILLLKYQPHYLEVTEGVSFFGRSGTRRAQEHGASGREPPGRLRHQPGQVPRRGARRRESRTARPTGWRSSTSPSRASSW